MHHLRTSCEPNALRGRVNAFVGRQHAVDSRTRRGVQATALSKKLQAAAAGGILSSLLATGAVLATEADLQSSQTPADLGVQVAAAQQQVQQVRAAPVAAAVAVVSPVPFDRVLLSIINVTDDLSLAAGGLLDLTAAANGPVSSTAAEPALSPTRPATTAGLQSSAQLTNVLHTAGVSAPPSALAGSTSNELEGSTTQRLSQQALAVATEALKLATLLEVGQEDGCDPTEQEMLQQIAAAARLVSIMAADIVQPAELGGADLPSSSSSSRSAPSPAAVTNHTAAAAAASADLTASYSDAEGLSTHHFAGLPVLGLQQEPCHVFSGAAVAAAPPVQCLNS